MNEIPCLILALIGGILLGLFFFGGLWWSTCKAISSSRPEVWFVGSLILRTSIVLLGFYYFAIHQWDLLLLCLIGFIAGRIFVVRLSDSHKQFFLIQKKW